MMLIIRASRLSSYGKNVAKPRYEAKDSQFGKKILQVSESSIWPFFLVLSIIVTFWSFYGEVLAEPYYYLQDGQFAKHCQTPLNHRFQLDLRWPKRLQISKILSHASKSSFSSSYFVLSMILTFWSFYGKIPTEPYYSPKDNQFPKHSHTPHNNPC